jgi:hypothetical protein
MPSLTSTVVGACVAFVFYFIYLNVETMQIKSVHQRNWKNLPEEEEAMLHNCVAFQEVKSNDTWLNVPPVHDQMNVSSLIDTAPIWMHICAQTNMHTIPTSWHSAYGRRYSVAYSKFQILPNQFLYVLTYYEATFLHY